ncbi:hypothetical protein BGX21_005513 [Mortierella sp. AD011]|nr:hypothetical protein BGX20_004655 [Mortierella sp. AD010]KAF9403306.1 hypothetical protein BGX21_005513 [Mortierella sp. AD011]
MAIDIQFKAFANPSNALLLGKAVTVASIGIFAGTALSYNTIIMPSIRKFSTTSSLAIWNETVNTSKALQTTMKAISIIGSAGLYHKTKNAAYLYGALTMALIIPYTLLAIAPLNKALVTIRQNNTVNGKSNSLKDNKSNDSNVEGLLTRWNRLHAGRTLLSYGALFITIYGVISDRGVRFIVFK